MSFRDNWLRGLVISALQLLAGGLIYKQQLQPWVENLTSLPRDCLVRIGGYIVGLSVLLLGLLRARTLWPWVQRHARHPRGRDVTVALTGQAMHLTPGSLRAVNVSDTWSLAPPSPPSSFKLS
ncbi:MAG TPA: hypothetical protein VMT66_00355 [Steroidobacteraceae bacterium]|nr:hypothetical protein [Steroidobacteraceae bacterium]